jgi:hypothetical protein
MARKLISVVHSEYKSKRTTHVNQASRNENGMKTKVKSINKTVETVTGEKLKRSAVVTLADFENDQDVRELLGDNLIEFAKFGYAKFCAYKASLALMGGSDDKEQRSLLRNFKGALESLINYADMPKEAAIAKLLAKDTFKPLVEVFESQKSNTSSLALDYSIAATLPVPGADSDADEAEETTEAA